VWKTRVRIPLMTLFFFWFFCRILNNWIINRPWEIFPNKNMPTSVDYEKSEFKVEAPFLIFKSAANCLTLSINYDLKTAIYRKTPFVKSKANAMLILRIFLYRNSWKYFSRKTFSKLKQNLKFLNPRRQLWICFSRKVLGRFLISNNVKNQHSIGFQFYLRRFSLNCRFQVVNNAQSQTISRGLKNFKGLGNTE
jgi:hypothetical protein